MSGGVWQRRFLSKGVLSKGEFVQGFFWRGGFPRGGGVVQGFFRGGGGLERVFWGEGGMCPRTVLTVQGRTRGGGVKGALAPNQKNYTGRPKLKS